MLYFSLDFNKITYKNEKMSNYACVLINCHIYYVKNIKKNVKIIAVNPTVRVRPDILNKNSRL